MNIRICRNRVALCALVLPVTLLGACSSGPSDATGSSQAVRLDEASGSRQIALRGSARPANVPDGYVPTPFGFFDPSCIAQVRPNEKLHRDGTIRDLAGSSRQTASCTAPRFDQAGREMPIGTAGAAKRATTPPPAASASYNGWLQDYNASSVGAVSYLSATWVVPAAPAAGNDGQIIYFFNGLEDLQTTESILQPVLTYSNGQWTATSWNCCASGTTFTGNTINVSPGDVIAGSVAGTNCSASTGLCNNWMIQTLDQTTGESSVLETESWGVALNWLFGAVEEVYGVTSCADLPASGSLTFANQIYTPIAGGTPRASWNFGPAPSSAPSCGYGGTNQQTSLKLGFSGAGSTGVTSDANGNFAGSCNNIALQGNNVLAARCYTMSGQLASTTLDLDTCIGNDNGSLTSGAGGDYAGSCSSCSLGGTLLRCQCAQYTGQSDPTVIDVNNYVSNCNGVLTCGGC